MALTPLYPVKDHVLLSEDAAALDGSVLAAHAMAAESALGLLGTTYTGDKKDRATVAVVRQVNLQVAQPKNPFLESETRGERSETFAVFRDLGGASALDVIAVQIVNALAAEAIDEIPVPVQRYGGIRSLR